MRLSVIILMVIIILIVLGGELLMNMELEILKEYVRISKYRYKVVKVLDGVKIPSQISMECGIRTNHISKVLKELKEKV